MVIEWRRGGHRVEEVWSYGGGGVVIGWRRCGHNYGGGGVVIGWRRCCHWVEEVWSYGGGGVVIGWRRCGHRRPGHWVEEVYVVVTFMDFSRAIKEIDPAYTHSETHVLDNFLPLGFLHALWGVT